jgi:hypothetical protein
MKVDQLLDDGQADAGAADRCIRGYSIERLPNPGEVLRGHARSLVIDSNARDVRFALRRHSDGLSLRTVLHGVVEKIQNDLSEVASTSRPRWSGYGSSRGNAS